MDVTFGFISSKITKRHNFSIRLDIDINMLYTETLDIVASRLIA